MAKSILMINGPNLNLLGQREPHIYGSATLLDVTQTAEEQCSSYGVKFDHFQSNWEGAIIDRIHEARGTADVIIINPAALTHTSIALRDALTGINTPFIEVHITNIHKREAFRHHSYLSEKAEAVICGLGVYGYTAAIDYAMKSSQKKNSASS